MIVSEGLFLSVELNATTLIFDVKKLTFAHDPVGHDPTGNRHFTIIGVVVESLLRGFGGGELIGVGIDSLFAQVCEFGPPLGN